MGGIPWGFPITKPKNLAQYLNTINEFTPTAKSAEGKGSLITASEDISKVQYIIQVYINSIPYTTYTVCSMYYPVAAYWCICRYVQ